MPSVRTGADKLEVCVPVATMWTRPGAPRDRDAAAVVDEPDVGDWVASLDATARKGLAGRTLTQLLIGERVQLLEEKGSWARVRALQQPSSKDAGGYPGWIRRNHLGARVGDDGPLAVVTATTTVCELGADSMALSFGTVLRRESEDVEDGRVLLPDGRRGRVLPADVSPGPAVEDIVVDRLGVLASARRFLGLRYLWGGTSAWGMDCSGLVHLVYRTHGVVVPRDAFDQAEAVAPVALGDVQPGDLYFFARPGEPVFHVGFVSRAMGTDGTRWMLHAPEGGELVEDAPLADSRRKTLVAAGRVTEAASR